MIKKRKILFIAPASIPCFGAEAIVNAKLLKILIDAGHEIDLVSKKSKWEFYPSTDYGLEGRLKSHHVVEVDNKVNFNTILKHIMCYFTFGVVYKGAHWAYDALKCIKHNLDLKEYDVVITKNYPSELVGYWIKKNYNTKWIATWNDPFPTDCYPAPYGNGFKQQPWYKKNILVLMQEGPDYNVIPSERLARYIDSYVHFKHDSIRVIPHVALSSEHKECKSEVLKLLVSGTNKSPRNPRKLIDAYIRIIEETGINSELVFLGLVDDEIRSYVSYRNQNSRILLLPPVSYEDSLEILKDYHVAIIIEADCDEGIFLPTKIVDFMQFKKPVFSISPRVGVLNDLYEKHSIGYFADCTDENSIYNELRKVFRDFKKGELISTVILPEFSESGVIDSYNNMF